MLVRPNGSVLQAHPRGHSPPINLRRQLRATTRGALQPKGKSAAHISMSIA